MRLVHDNVVDGVLLRVLVVAEPDAEALWVKARKVLREGDVRVSTGIFRTPRQRCTGTRRLIAIAKRNIKLSADQP